MSGSGSNQSSFNSLTSYLKFKEDVKVIREITNNTLRRSREYESLQSPNKWILKQRLMEYMVSLMVMRHCVREFKENYSYVRGVQDIPTPPYLLPHIISEVTEFSAASSEPFIEPMLQDNSPSSSETSLSDNDPEPSTSAIYSQPSTSAIYSQPSTSAIYSQPSASSSNIFGHGNAGSEPNQPRTSTASSYMYDISEERHTPTLSSIPLTRMRCVRQYHELIGKNFDLIEESLKPPVFSSECVEVQKLLISLFRHLLKDFEDFIGFFDGKEASDVFEASEQSTLDISRLQFVRLNFASKNRLSNISQSIDCYKRTIQGITGYEFQQSSSQDSMSTSSTSVNNASGTTATENVFSDNEFEGNLESLINLNEEVISLLYSSRDTIRAMIEYCYRIKISRLDPRLIRLLKDWFPLAEFFLNLRNYYGRNNALIQNLALKERIASVLKNALRAILKSSLNFWN